MRLIKNNPKRINVQKSTGIQTVKSKENTKLFLSSSLSSGIEKIKNIVIEENISLDEDNELSVIIPIRDREEQLPTCLHFFNKSIVESKRKVTIIVVEHSAEKKLEKISLEFGAKYIWIRSFREQFNKCLCHNIGALVSKSKYIMFHDVDLVFEKDSIEKIFENLKDGLAVQCFFNRRVLYLPKHSSDYVRKNKIIDENLEFNPGEEGAPGGSILVERNLFELVGGFDPYYFWGYSIEDAFFWKKIELFSEMKTCFSPKVEMYHLWHEPRNNTNPNISIEKHIFDTFNNLETKDKMKYIEEFRKEYINLFKRMYAINQKTPRI